MFWKQIESRREADQDQEGKDGEDIADAGHLSRSLMSAHPSDKIPNYFDDKWMQVAFDQAKKALDEGEVHIVRSIYINRQHQQMVWPDSWF